MQVLRVSTNSNPNAVAQSIIGMVQRERGVTTQTIGAGALNQAVKALAIARRLLASRGVDLVCRPAFVTLTIDGEERTAIRLKIEMM